jgi:hypothetical protein
MHVLQCCGDCCGSINHAPDVLYHLALGFMKLHHTSLYDTVYKVLPLHSVQGARALHAGDQQCLLSAAEHSLPSA